MPSYFHLSKFLFAWFWLFFQTISLKISYVLDTKKMQQEIRVKKWESHEDSIIGKEEKKPNETSRINKLIRHEEYEGVLNRDKHLNTAIDTSDIFGCI